MKDAKYRILTLADLHDERPQRANRAGTQLKVWCPECKDQHRHRSLQYDVKSGAFYCFYCGLHGRVQLGNGTGSAAAPTPYATASATTSPLQRQASEDVKALPAPTAAKADAQGVASTLGDYVPLPDEVLAGIADISLDPNERNAAQLLVRRYLAEQKIPLDSAQRMRWGVATVMVKAKGEEQGRLRTCLVYRNYVDGYCCNAKYRSVSRITRRVTRNGQTIDVEEVEKAFTQESSYTPTAPYNIQALSPRSDSHDSGGSATSTCDSATSTSTLYICEGEKDCLVLQLLGFDHVISMSNGAQTDPEKTFEAFLTWLAPYGRVVICGDRDRPGREMTARLVQYFDDREVAVVEWDQRVYGKDITEVYQRVGEDRARQLVLNAYPVEREDIMDCDNDEDIEQICRLGCDLERSDKYSVGIGPLTDRHFMLTPEGGLIIVTGTPNTGKTDFLNYLTTRLMATRGSDVCYCSFETPNKQRHLARLTQEWIGATPAKLLTHEQLRGYVQQVARHAIHLRLRRQKPTAANILRKADTVLMRHPAMEYLIIDPYLYMDVGTGRNITETDAIKAMLTQVQDWAQEHHVWVFIVAHPRKLKKEDGTNELEKIDMYTIAGSANWANIADYILALERVNKKDLNVDYTRLDVLKVRDQEVCTPGTLYYQRQTCGRYDERPDIETCENKRGGIDAGPWGKM